ncbi:hypothetical protein CTAYLR_005327 [Chrysophaeum taylorii]|uniref:16S rRNA (Guanine(966)-N(2))-methyltransferase RsmD n=1 Tax=Chrysophaeum taylorii TaxID=2483200 RepID=A0AAD7XI64_9STRA|nr:hypothetical protein CTAYLR_005327 [Chrysophaeum taylorii]
MYRGLAILVGAVAWQPKGSSAPRLVSRWSEAVPSEPVRAPRPFRKKRPQATRVGRGGQQKKLLRVIAGEARGRRLESPETLLRPMMSRVREALFSTLLSLGVFRAPRRVNFLDVFCGSGSVGIEALSRGADFAAFVDLSRDACDVTTRNADACGFGGRHAVICEPAERALARDALADRTFDVVALTPPYEEVSYAQLAQALVDSPLLNDDAVVVIEYPVELGSMPPFLGNHRQIVGLRNRRYGRTVLAFYAKRPTGQLPFDFRHDEFAGGG